MFAVLMLFLLPIGGGIPAGVLLAHTRGIPWTGTAGLYLLSDVILALAFEPILRLIIALASRSDFLVRLGMAMKAAMAQSVAHHKASGPFSLILASFALDPMTGRTAALAAGYNLLVGWTLAITGDMLYYAVIALATLRLNAYVRNPERTVWVILGAMILVPILVRRVRSRFTKSSNLPGAP